MPNPNKITSPDKQKVAPHLAAIAALGLTGFNIERGPNSPSTELPAEPSHSPSLEGLRAHLREIDGPMPGTKPTPGTSKPDGLPDLNALRDELAQTPPKQDPPEAH